MKIDLLLNRVSFEHAVKTGELSFNGWFHGPASGDKDIENATLSMIDLRKEPWGGLFVYGPTGQIFMVDDAAFALLERLKAGESVHDLGKKPGDVAASDIDSFRTQLRKLDIDL